MNNNTFIKWLTALITLVAVAYLISTAMLTREKKVSPVKEDTLTGSMGAKSIIQNFQHIESHLAEISWELNARKAEVLENEAILYGIKMRFYTPEKEVISLTGNDGAVNLRTNDIYIQGNVEAVYNSDYYLYSEKLNWDSRRKKLTSPGPVRIVGPEGEIKGSSMLAKLKTNIFVIKGGVTVNLKGNMESYVGSLNGESS